MTRVELKSARVYDPVLRLLHWVNALLIVALLISGLLAMYAEPGEITAWLHEWHGWLGAALVVSLSARIAWGLAGPGHARFADMWQPEAWRNSFRTGHPFTPPVRFGHHPTASLVYLALYSLLVGLASTGLMLLAMKQGHGPLTHWLGWDLACQIVPVSLHEIAAWLVLGFISLHLGALVLHPLRHHVPVAQAMFTGVQYLRKKAQE